MIKRTLIGVVCLFMALPIRVSAQTYYRTAPSITVSKLSAAANEDEFQIRAVGGVLTSVVCRNAHATVPAILKLVQLTAANTTPGTSVIWREFIVPAAGTLVVTDLNASFTPALTGYIVLGKAATAVDEVAADDVRCDVAYQ